mmetsp:Transcript_83749/g.241855  ORF Transcript_83749/g.241855 Transcript_83749/m.241855 type:complete len:349 (-) Transcript_83749:374-1420(-)
MEREGRPLLQLELLEEGLSFGRRGHQHVLPLRLENLEAVLGPQRPQQATRGLRDPLDHRTYQRTPLLHKVDASGPGCGARARLLSHGLDILHDRLQDLHAVLFPCGEGRLAFAVSEERRERIGEDDASPSRPRRVHSHAHQQIHDLGGSVHPLRVADELAELRELPATEVPTADGALDHRPGGVRLVADGAELMQGGQPEADVAHDLRRQPALAQRGADALLLPLPRGLAQPHLLGRHGRRHMLVWRRRGPDCAIRAPPPLAGGRRGRAVRRSHRLGVRGGARHLGHVAAAELPPPVPEQLRQDQIAALCVGDRGGGPGGDSNLRNRGRGACVGRGAETPPPLVEEAG